ncbi:MAG TPA: hypothetical protein VF884_01920 [Nitrososphaeraceae archaeon]
MDNFSEQLFEMIGRSRTKSKAAAVVTLCQMIVGHNPDRIKFKAASVPSADKVKVIANFINRHY